MTVKLELANGNWEIFDTESYNVSTETDMHPLICSVSVYNGGKCVFHKTRKWKWWYKHFTFKSFKVQKQLEQLNSENNK